MAFNTTVPIRGVQVPKVSMAPVSNVRRAGTFSLKGIVQRLGAGFFHNPGAPRPKPKPVKPVSGVAR